MEFVLSTGFFRRVFLSNSITLRAQPPRRLLDQQCALAYSSSCHLQHRIPTGIFYRGKMLQEELAIRLRISQGQLSKIERGWLAPSAQTLVQLSEEFGKPVDWLLRGDKA